MKTHSHAHPGSFKHSLLALILVVAMLLSAMSALAVEGAPPPPAAADLAGLLGGAAAPTFVNVTTGQKNLISMTEKQTFVYAFPLDSANAAAQAAALAAGQYTLTLQRDKGAQDETYYAHQILGGPLADWTIWNDTAKAFTIGAPVVQQVGGQSWVFFTIQNDYLLKQNTNVVNDRAVRNAVLDYTGVFTLSCAIAPEGGTAATLGACDVRINPYDSYHTASEVNQAIIEIVNYVRANVPGLYAEYGTLGQSTKAGEDILYLILADSKQSVDNYQAIKNKIETQGALTNAEIDAVKVPILYSNVHSDESDGADGILDLAWLIARAGAADGTIPYEKLTGFTAAGQAQLQKELDAKNIHWSKLLQDEDGTPWSTGLGFLTGTDQSVSAPMGDLMETYYNTATETVELTNNAGTGLLDEVFLLMVPSENQDGRTFFNRQNGNGFDLNRDNLFQTQKETQLMAQFISQWNPITYIELHGFVEGYQVEPCSPPHEPNFEYDLLIENSLKAGEAFGIAAVANNTLYNSYVIPMRDYLTEKEDQPGVPYWAAPWDDMSTNYTPQYSMLHGTVAYTVEVPTANQQANRSLTYGLLGHADYVAENKVSFVTNMVEFYNRSIHNSDVASVSKWYVDVYDTPGAEADVFRPKYAGNNNFFPEAYIIPVDVESQRNPAAALEMGTFLLRNSVKLATLKQDVTFGGVTYKAGSLVVDMYQAKRNVANGALYDGVVIDSWHDLYSEPITAFGHTRGFDYAAVDVKGTITADMLTPVTAVAAPAPILLAGSGDSVILMNNGTAAVLTVNKLLNAGKAVALITEGQYRGHYLITKALYDSDVALSGLGVVCQPVATVPAAMALKQPKLFVPGAVEEYASYVNAAGEKVYYGVSDYNNMRNTSRNFDLFAYGQQMGFTIVDNVADANMIVGNRALFSGSDASALTGVSKQLVDAIKAGTPYLGAGENVLAAIKAAFLADTAFGYATTSNIHDALFTVTYPADSLATASYKTYGDNVQYSYGGAYIKAAPQGAEVLVQATGDDLLEGFFAAADVTGFKNSIQGFHYEQGGMDLTVFAGTLTNKAHQQDDYRLAATSIFEAVASAGAATSYIQGVTPTTFAPDKSLTRAEAAVILSRLFNPADIGSPDSFSDVAADDWFYSAVTEMASAGLVSNVADGTFKPNAPLTKAELVAQLLGCMGIVPSGTATFSDVPADHWASAAIATAATLGYVEGYQNGTFNPDGAVTRAEAVVIINSAVGLADQAAAGPFTDVPATHWAAAAIAAAAH